jgi:uncharacterized protein (DUF4415 family)
MDKRDNEAAAQPDEDSPEWTTGAILNARPALEVIAEVFGEASAEAVRRRPGRPPKSGRKINQTLRLDADVLDGYRQSGPGWQARINQVLREHMPSRTVK